MAATKTDLFNRAIGYIGIVTQDIIQDPDEISSNARRCSRFYDSTLEAFLNEHDWAWAKKYVALNEDISTPEENGVSWLFVYVWPTDCIEPQWLTVAGTGQGDLAQFPTVERVPYEVAINVNNDQVIYTDLEDAVLRYTTRLETFGLWPGTAFEALSVKLALNMAPSFTGGLNRVRALQSLYFQTLDSAKQASSTMEEPLDRPSDEFTTARHGLGFTGRDRLWRRP